MISMRTASSAQSMNATQDASDWETMSDAHASAVAKANALNGAISATMRQLAIAIWQQHPDWEGTTAYSQFASCSYVEFKVPEYPNLRLHLFPGGRVHITNRIYWDATLINAFETPAYIKRRHKPFFRRVIRAADRECIAAIIDQWLAANGAFYDALVEAEAADAAARASREQQARQELWAQLLGPMPLDPRANIQTAERRSTPRIELTVGNVAVSATPNGAALTIVLPSEQKTLLPEIIATLNQTVSRLTVAHM